MSGVRTANAMKNRSFVLREYHITRVMDTLPFGFTVDPDNYQPTTKEVMFAIQNRIANNHIYLNHDVTKYQELIDTHVEDVEVLGVKGTKTTVEYKVVVVVTYWYQELYEEEDESLSRDSRESVDSGTDEAAGACGRYGASCQS